MKLRLLNWSGHNNLGDDAMDALLRSFFHAEFVTEGEDVTIFGGGTLISPLSEFFPLIHTPEKTVGFSLGVSSNWKGEWLEVLERMPAIFVRDFFSYEALTQAGLSNVHQSVDLLCSLLPGHSLFKTGLAANIMFAPGSIVPHHQAAVEKVKEGLANKVCYYFALSPDEDLATISHAELIKDAQGLVDTLANFDTVIATRLHANVCAFMAGSRVNPIFYDPKIMHFWERVAALTPPEAHRLARKDLFNLRNLCQKLAS